MGEDAVVAHLDSMCSAYFSETRRLKAALQHANNEVQLLRGDFENIEHARCFHTVLGRSLREDTEIGSLDECEDEAIYAANATKALPLITAEIPGSAVCPTTTTTT